MTYLICYDISNDRQRLQISKRLEKAGCLRIQKSVFIAPNFDARQLQILRGSIQRLAIQLSADESILVVPIEKDNTHDITWIGDSLKISQIIQKHLFRLF